MELNDIITLVKAGYTKNEIMQMAQPDPTTVDSEPVQLAMDLPSPAAEPVPAPVAEPVAVPVAQPAPAQAPAQVEEQKQPTMTQLMESIARLTSAVQANAIAQSVIPAGISNPPNAEDMLAEIIRPSYKERV